VDHETTEHAVKRHERWLEEHRAAMQRAEKRMDRVERLFERELRRRGALEEQVRPTAETSWDERPSNGSADVEKFVHGGEDYLRLNVQVPRSLRAHIKSWCALHGREIQDVVNEVLRKHFPK
jgi:hypothetical protein